MSPTTTDTLLSSRFGVFGTRFKFKLYDVQQSIDPQFSDGSALWD